VRETFLHASRRASALALAGAAVLCTTFLCVIGPAATPAGAAPTLSADRLSLQSQSPAFVSRQTGVTLRVDVGSNLPASQLSLQVTLYSAIVDRYTLRQALAGSLPSPLTPLGNPGVIPLSLKQLAWIPGKGVTLHLPVSAPDLPGTAGTGTGGVTLSIYNCAPPTCGGVYPLQVSLLEEGVGPLASLTTYLIVTPPSEVVGTHPLHFAWVMPLGSSPAISPSGSAALDPSDISQLDELNSDLVAAPNASVSLDLFPQFVESLSSRSDRTAQAALFNLHALTAPSGQAEIVPGTFMPVDLDGLVASGLSSDVSAQLARSRQVLQPDFSYQADEYAANRPINDASLALLEQAGITRLIVPSTGVAPLSTAFAQWTPTAPFLIPGSAVEAMASDPGLEEDLVGNVSPALKAQRMLADLSIQYFDNPGAEQAMAVESNIGVPTNPAFLQAMLTGLSESSIVHAVTLNAAFDAVSPGSSNTSPNKRLLVAPTPSSSELVPASYLYSAQQALAALGSVLPKTLHPRGSVPLSDLVLMSEGTGESLAQRQTYVSSIEQQANSLADLVSLPFGRTITVTSSQAKIPISIVSKARAPFMARLTVSSLELGFPKGHSWLVKIYPQTNIVPILLSARTSGDFSLELTLTTQTGFTIQSGSMTIRSTAISGVAVALSIGAAAFLVVWWMRSILTKRRKKHKLRGAALAAGAIPGSASGA
jgi:hypothetical protein